LFKDDDLLWEKKENCMSFFNFEKNFLQEQREVLTILNRLLEEKYLSQEQAIPQFVRFFHSIKNNDNLEVIKATVATLELPSNAKKKIISHIMNDELLEEVVVSNDLQQIDDSLNNIEEIEDEAIEEGIERVLAQLDGDEPINQEPVDALDFEEEFNAHQQKREETDKDIVEDEAIEEGIERVLAQLDGDEPINQEPVDALDFEEEFNAHQQKREETDKDIVEDEAIEEGIERVLAQLDGDNSFEEVTDLPLIEIINSPEWKINNDNSGSSITNLVSYKEDNSAKPLTTIILEDISLLDGLELGSYNVVIVPKGQDIDQYSLEEEDASLVAPQDLQERSPARLEEQVSKNLLRNSEPQLEEIDQDIEEESVEEGIERVLEQLDEDEPINPEPVAAGQDIEEESVEEGIERVLEQLDEDEPINPEPVAAGQDIEEESVEEGIERVLEQLDGDEPINPEPVAAGQDIEEESVEEGIERVLEQLDGDEPINPEPVAAGQDIEEESVEEGIERVLEQLDEDEPINPEPVAAGQDIEEESVEEGIERVLEQLDEDEPINPEPVAAGQDIEEESVEEGIERVLEQLDGDEPINPEPVAAGQDIEEESVEEGIERVLEQLDEDEPINPEPVAADQEVPTQDIRKKEAPKTLNEMYHNDEEEKLDNDDWWLNYSLQEKQTENEDFGEFVLHREE
jgi:hypothetical protein